MVPCCFSDLISYQSFASCSLLVMCHLTAPCSCLMMSLLSLQGVCTSLWVEYLLCGNSQATAIPSFMSLLKCHVVETNFRLLVHKKIAFSLLRHIFYYPPQSGIFFLINLTWKKFMCFLFPIMYSKPYESICIQSL